MADAKDPKTPDVKTTDQPSKEAPVSGSPVDSNDAVVRDAPEAPVGPENDDNNNVQMFDADGNDMLAEGYVADTPEAPATPVSAAVLDTPEAPVGPENDDNNNVQMFDADGNDMLAEGYVADTPKAPIPEDGDMFVGLSRGDEDEIPMEFRAIPAEMDTNEPDPSSGPSVVDDILDKPKADAAEPEAESKTPEDAAAKQKALEEEAETELQAEMRRAKLRSDLDLGDNRLILHEKWGKEAFLTPEVLDALNKITEDPQGGMLFNLNNGHKVEWQANFQGSGQEFIGLKRRGFFPNKFDEIDAKAVVGLAVSKQWTSINVYGDEKQKEMMWMEAQLQGLDVSNFEPYQDADIRRRLAEELQKRHPGLTDGDGPMAHEINPDMPGVSKGDTPPEVEAELAADAPEVPETPEAEAPETPADDFNNAVVDAPEADAPAAPEVPETPADDSENTILHADQAVDMRTEPDAPEVELPAIEAPEVTETGMIVYEGDQGLEASRIAGPAAGDMALAVYDGDSKPLRAEIVDEIPADAIHVDAEVVDREAPAADAPVEALVVVDESPQGLEASRITSVEAIQPLEGGDLQDDGLDDLVERHRLKATSAESAKFFQTVKEGLPDLPAEDRAALKEQLEAIAPGNIESTHKKVDPGAKHTLMLGDGQAPAKPADTGAPKQIAASTKPETRVTKYKGPAS